jgi:REP element-mobilizing transposase RayT
LFQDRFKSQPIDDERYLFACCRYIHNNPIKAGVTKKAENFKWSSYNNYLIGKADPGILDIDFILNILSLEKNESIKFFKEFNDYDDNIFLEADTRDTEYNLDLINSILKKYELNIDKFKEINDKKVRNKVIKDLKTNTKTPIRLLSELLGVSKDIIFRA